MPEGMERPRPERQEQLREESEFSPEKILDMPPQEIAALFTELAAKGELESFLEKSTANDSVVAQFSYWEKWLQKDQRRLVDEAVSKKREAYEGKEDKDSLPLHLEKKFTSEELSLIFSHTGSIQLCFGCSMGCPFCAFDAPPGVRENIPYSQLANLFQKYGKELGKSKPFLYWASEPSDYASKVGLEDKTYQDVHQLAVEYAGYSPHITSKEIGNEEWLKFLGDHGDARVSLFGQSPEKIADIKNKKIKAIGEEEQHIKGIGVSFKSQENNEFFPAGIGCINGVLLTPRGLYGVAQLPISQEFPQGQVVAPLEKISDIKIKPGDQLKNILRQSVIVNPTAILDRPEHEISSMSSYLYSTTEDNRYANFFEGEFRKLVDIKTKNKLYRVWYDKEGIVKSAREVDEVEEERIKAEVKKLRRRGKETQNIDIADTWNDAFAMAEKILKEDKLHAIAFVSKREFEKGHYVPTLLRGTGFTDEETLHNLKQVAPMLYGNNNTRFRLMFQRFEIYHPEIPEGEVDVLVVVYLKEGEKLFRKSKA